MQFQSTEDGFHLLIEKDELLMATLKAFVEERKIPSATLTGLGALKGARLGFYHLEEKKYDERVFSGDHELISLVGNASWHGNEAIIHCHVTLGDEQFRVWGGHLFEAEVAVVGEVFLSVKNTKLVRVHSDCIGLKVQSLTGK